MALIDEIEGVRHRVTTDSYQMSVGEIVNMYREKEIIINPNFQRLFRWDTSQKSRLIESILIGIPLPSIFVYETPQGKWELVDGLQRVSTLLEFMGLLLEVDGTSRPPSALEATTYLPGLHNAVWSRSDAIVDVPKIDQMPVDNNLQLTIRRSRIGVEILKRPSDAHTKYDLFQRLNSGGSIANAQELRNCIIVMVNTEFFQQLKDLSTFHPFVSLLHMTEIQQDAQKNIELLTRFLVYRYIPYDGRLDVENYIDGGIVAIAEKGPLSSKVVQSFKDTFKLLNEALGSDALKQRTGNQFKGRVGLTALEIVAVGIATNYDKIKKMPDPNAFVRSQTEALWDQPEVKSFSRPGLRGTQRIQKSIPFGSTWYDPEVTGPKIARKIKR